MLIRNTITLFLFLLLTLSAPFMLLAQDTEVELTVGFLTSNDILNYNDTPFRQVFPDEDVTSSDTHSTGIGIAFRHLVHHNIKVGGQLTYQRVDKEFVQDNIKIGEGTVDFFTLLGNANFYWLQSGSFGIFSGAGLGFSFSNEDQFDLNDDELSRTETGLFFAWQANAIGFEFGRDFRFVTNAGFGTQGVVSFGLKFRF
ncbi:MAG: hypothetical protein ACFCU6_04350 [Balneolaceae bacterium]